MNTTKVYKCKIKRNSTLSPPYTSITHVKLTCQRQQYFSGKGNVTALGVYPALRNWKSNRKGTLVSVWICIWSSQAQRFHLAAKYWGKFFKLPGKVTPRTQSNSTHHCLPVFIHQRGYIQHMTPNITIRPRAPTSLNPLTDSYFNIFLKFNISNLWKALCRLFSSPHCCRQPTCRSCPASPPGAALLKVWRRRNVTKEELKSGLWIHWNQTQKCDFCKSCFTIPLPFGPR